LTEEASNWHWAHRIDGGGVRLAPGWQAGVVVTVRSDLGYHWGFSAQRRTRDVPATYDHRPPRPPFEPFQARYPLSARHDMTSRNVPWNPPMGAQHYLAWRALWGALGIGAGRVFTRWGARSAGAGTVRQACFLRPLGGGIADWPPDVDWLDYAVRKQDGRIQGSPGYYPDPDPRRGPLMDHWWTDTGPVSRLCWTVMLVADSTGGSRLDDGR